MKIMISLSAKPARVNAEGFKRLSISEQRGYLEAYPNSAHKQLFSGKVKTRKPKQETKSAQKKSTPKKKANSKAKPKATKKVSMDQPDIEFVAKDPTKQEINFARSIFKDVGFQLNEITKAIRSPAKNIVNAFNEPSIANVMKAAGGSVKGLSKAAMEVLKLPNTVLGATFKELHKTNAFQKLDKGMIKVDKFLEDYPAIKKIGGPLMAGAMIYQWLNMSFSGDFDDDFNVSAIGDALQGNYSVQDFVSSPSGAKALAQLATGIATGGIASFPWHSSMNIAFAAMYTGAKKLGDSGLADEVSKVMERIKTRHAEKQPVTA